MAQEKLSTRQKMINMLYLVLLTLLALQVSSAVLDKFSLIEKSLKHVVEKLRIQNNDRFLSIESLTEKRGNKAKDVVVLEKAMKSVDMTSEMMKYLESFRKGLIEASGGLDIEGKLINSEGYDAQMNWTIGSTDSKSGEGYVLKEKLNKFAQDMNSIDDSMEISPLALDADQMVEFSNDQDHRNKDFVELYFGHTPTIACLAILRQIETEVLRVEEEILSDLAREIGAEDIRFDRIIPIVRPDSRIVAAGTKYQAEMFIGASSTTVRPVMEYNGKPVEVKDGRGLIEFIATGGSYNSDGNIAKKWNGSITINTPAGDTTLIIEEEYIVAKPVIQIQSASVSALYFNCGNELNVQVPALGSFYDPDFKISGGSIIKSSDKGKIVLIPNTTKLKMNVYNSDNFIGAQEFRVRRIPLPSVRFYAGGKEINQKKWSKQKSTS